MQWRGEGGVVKKAPPPVKLHSMGDMGSWQGYWQTLPGCNCARI